MISVRATIKLEAIVVTSLALVRAKLFIDNHDTGYKTLLGFTTRRPLNRDVPVHV